MNDIRAMQVTDEMTGSPFRFDLREMSGALGDLGTLLPLMLGVIVVAGLGALPVVMGFGFAYIATALTYRLPIPVQPMKAVAAVLLTTGVTTGAVAASGVMIGVIFLVLAVTGWIDRLGRLVPQSVLAGLQLGLGAALGLVALGLIAKDPLIGIVSVGILALLLRLPRVPAALIAIVLMMLLGLATGAAGLEVPVLEGFGIGLIGLPSLAELEEAAFILALPQLSLTLTNAILLTALVAGDSFGARAAKVTPRRLSATTGLMNLLLSPFGALPMCHGVGGVVAHHRFGARSGGAPLMLGLLLVVLALLPGGAGFRLLGLIPAAGLGALLLFAAIELALSRRLFDARPSCRPVIAVTAAAVLIFDPFWGLVAGSLGELIRRILVRRLVERRDSQI